MVGASWLLRRKRLSRFGGIHNGAIRHRAGRETSVQPVSCGVRADRTSPRQPTPLGPPGSDKHCSRTSPVAAPPGTVRVPPRGGPAPGAHCPRCCVPRGKTAQSARHGWRAAAPGSASPNRARCALSCPTPRRPESRSPGRRSGTRRLCRRCRGATYSSADGAIIFGRLYQCQFEQGCRETGIRGFHSLNGRCRRQRPDRKRNRVDLGLFAWLNWWLLRRFRGWCARFDLAHRSPGGACGRDERGRDA